MSQSLAKDKAILAKLDAALETFKTNKNKSQFTNVQAEQLSVLKSIVQNLKHIALEASFEPTFAKQVQALTVTLEGRTQSVIEMQAKVVEFVQKDNPDNNQKVALTKALRAHDEEMLKFNSDLNEHLSKIKF